MHSLDNTTLEDNSSLRMVEVEETYMLNTNVMMICSWNTLIRMIRYQVENKVSDHMMNGWVFVMNILME